MITTPEMTMENTAAAEENATPGTVQATNRAPQGRLGFSSILACVNSSPHASDVIAWASALAGKLGASLKTLHVLDPSIDRGAPHDPVAWELRRREAQSRIRNLLRCAGEDDAERLDVDVSVGRFQERFQALLATSAVDLCVIGAAREAKEPAHRIGDTARRVVESAPCSVLIVPPRTEAETGEGAAGVRRLMVPLDCSRRAETALPAAIALADAFGAEIVMAHAVPEPAITEIGPPEVAEMALRSNCVEHNRKAAERYMSRLRARMALDRRPIRTVILSGADPRHRLLRAAADEGADLIVLAAKGAGGYADQSLGSVADFLVTHLRKPLLIVRPRRERMTSTLTGAANTAAGGSHIRGQA